MMHPELVATRPSQLKEEPVRDRPLQAAMAIGLAVGFAATLVLGALGMALPAAALAGSFAMIVGFGAGLLIIGLIDRHDRRSDR